jgi:hypothetical protein
MRTDICTIDLFSFSSIEIHFYTLVSYHLGSYRLFTLFISSWFLQAINKHILSCDFENTKFEVLSVDSQNSLEDGIFIMVIGFMTGKDNQRRKFSQMFYLARQNTLVVLNDMLRYVDQEDSSTTETPCEPVTEIVRPADGLKKAEKTELKQKNVASVEKSVNAAVEKNAAPLDNGKMKQSEKAVITQKVTEPDAAPQPDGAKRSFADIVGSMAKNAAPFQVKSPVQAPVQKPKYVGQPRAAAAPQKPAYVSKSIKKNDQKVIEVPGTSIFVANLPLNAMPPQLFELFKDFGPIKENGIQVRSSRGNANPVCFGFISFETVASVQSVLQVNYKYQFLVSRLKVFEFLIFKLCHSRLPRTRPSCLQTVSFV